MIKKTKIWLIVASALLFVGLIVFSVSMTTLKWDFKKLSNTTYVENTYEITEDFTSISINTSTSDIKIAPSTSDKVEVKVFENEKEQHSVSVVNGTLDINCIDNRKWYDHIDFGFKSSNVTVFLPISQYENLNIKSDTSDVYISKEFTFNNVDITLSTGDLKYYATTYENLFIKRSTGKVLIENATAKNITIQGSTGDTVLKSVSVNEDISIKCSTGDVILKNITMVNLISTGDTGEMELENVIASGKFDIKRSTGDIELESCDASEIYITTDTGDVEGSLLTEKIFKPKTDTGNVRVPDTTSGGLCKITTDTGDIKLTIK